MTGRQSVLGLKGRQLRRILHWAAGLVSLPRSPVRFLGVYEEQSEKLAPRPHGGLYCWDSGPG